METLQYAGLLVGAGCTVVHFTIYRTSGTAWVSRSPIGSSAALQTVFQYVEWAGYACCLLALALFLREPPTAQFSHVITTIIIGSVLVAGGLYTLFLSIRELGDNFSPCDNARRPHHVVTTGVYGYVRHPIYSSNLLQVAGLAVVYRSTLLIAYGLVLGALYRLLVANEERGLIQIDDAYREYRQFTGMFIPRAGRCARNMAHNLRK